MSISMFFVLSPRGDTIISKDFRGDIPAGSAEAFFRTVKSWDKGDAPPVFLLDGVNYIYIRKNGLLIACATRYNMSPSLGIELLNRTAKVFKDYCGVLSEESIRANFILIYELLDEVLDYGYPQNTSTETLKNFVYNEAVAVDLPVPARGTGSSRTVASVASQKPIATLARASAQGGGGGGAKQKNEIFVDILERLNVLFSASGHVLNSTIDGCIQMKSYLAGNPELKLALNEDLVIGVGGGAAPGAVVLDDCNFHECVRLDDFEARRTLSFFPPDGEFVVLNYRVTQSEFRPPFRVFPGIEEVSPYKLDVLLRVRADIPEAYYGANVVVRCNLPRGTAACVCDLGPGAIGQSAEYQAGTGGAKTPGGDADKSQADDNRRVVWTIKKFLGNTEQTLRVRVTLASPATASTKKEVGPVSLGFEIPMYNVSNLQVKYLRIADQGKAYNPYRWVRYVTQSSSYVCRV